MKKMLKWVVSLLFTDVGDTVSAVTAKITRKIPKRRRL